MLVRDSLIYIVIVVFLCVFGAVTVSADCFECMSCAELIHMAKQSQQDLRAIKGVLRSAISVGDMNMLRSYKLNQGSALRQSRLIMKALETKGCLDR
jgi:hypothetical protein